MSTITDTTGRLSRGPVLALAMGALLVTLGCGGAGDHSGHTQAAKDGDHAGHDDHSGHAGHADHEMSFERDAEGRRLFGHSHVMAPSLYDELRANVPLYRNFTNSEIDLSMVQMGAEYQWYISPPELRGDSGILILTHGFREQGDKIFKQQLAPIANALPTSLSLGMAMMMSEHIQLSIDDLEAAGAERIVVVPATSTRHNELMRQWEYVLGKRDTPEFASVGQVKSKARILVATPPEDDGLIADILLDHAKEISTNPAREAVFVVSHGASGQDAAMDNPNELRILQNLARYVQEDGGFASSGAFILQDDAPPEVRKANVERLRKAVGDEIKAGRQVLIVTNLIGARTIQPKLRSDLKDLDYKFNVKGIAQHPNFITWIGEAAREKLEKDSA